MNSLQLRAQTYAPYVPNVIPPSPDAAALMKFTDIPVSPYTGTADITVPIYTIQAKGITVPVTLDYHTGGVKLKDEASWVGLGWALEAGGRISRTIMNYDDFGTQGKPYFTTAIPQLAGDMAFTKPDQPIGAANLGPYFYDFFCSYMVATTAGNENYSSAFITGVDEYDVEPDIFSYSFPGHSGKFIITRAGNVVLQKQDNISIQFLTNGQSFTITDDQGNKYYFNVLETEQTVGAATPVSSWLLSKITTELQDSVLFTYGGGGGSVSTTPDVNQTYNAYCTISGTYSSSPSPTSYNSKTLQSIDFNGGHLQFLVDATRNDLLNGYKLDSVILYSKNAAGTLTYLKEHDFYYSYFNGSYPGGNTYEFNRLRLDSVKEVSGGMSLPPYSFIYNDITDNAGSAKHSFNIDHWGYFNGTANSTLIPTMSVEYNPLDENQFTLPQIVSYTGANREPNLEYMQTFSLQQVTYPTGGKTVLSYQANDYDFTNSNSTSTDFQYLDLISMDTIDNITHHGTTSGTVDLTHIFPVLPTGSAQSNMTVNVAFIYQNNNHPYQNTTNEIYFTLTGPGVNITQDINGATCQQNSPVCSVSIPLTITTPGVFNWAGTIVSAIDTVSTFSEIHVTFEYQITQQDYNLLENNSFITPASGLRIQSITNYKDPTTIASEKLYTYGYLQDKLGTGNPQAYSYGRIMSFPSYARYESMVTNTGGYCTNLSLFSSSNTALTSVIQGNVVGYDQVTEYNIDPVSGLDIGKTVYNYYNSNDTSYSYSGYRMPGTLNMGYSLNGLLKSKIEYADYGKVYTKLAETDNYYHTTNRIVYFSPKYVFLWLAGHSNQALNGLLCQADTAVEVQTDACFYPSIKSEKILLDSTVNINYQQGDITKSVTSRDHYFYDNPVHYQVTRSSTTTSKGDTLITKMKYPQDYMPTGGNTILDSMIGRNMVSETIEKQDSLYYAGSSAGYITGAQLSLYRILSSNSNTIIPDKIYKLDVQSPITNFQQFAVSGNSTSMDSRNRQMISFDQYDANNNIQQYTTTDQNPVTIIWDYVHMYPIAQVKNAIITDVAASSFESDGFGNWTYTGTSTPDTTSITGNNCYNLGQTSGTITKTGLISANTYVVSYWTKNSSALSITGTITGYPIQGKTIKGWTYFEHKVTGQTTITVGGTGYIDELRLYPATAQMTTYTYSPMAGMTTSCDVDNKVTYYIYDGYQRLKRIKDQDGNIIKTIQYHYANQNPGSQ